MEKVEWRENIGGTVILFINILNLMIFGFIISRFWGYLTKPDSLKTRKYVKSGVNGMIIRAVLNAFIFIALRFIIGTKSISQLIALQPFQIFLQHAICFIFFIWWRHSINKIIEQNN